MSISLKTHSLSDVFTARTRAGDMAWAEQAMSMGFNAYSELSKGHPWVVSAATNDTKKGSAIALRLIKDVFDVLHVDTKVLGRTAMGVILEAIKTAVSHGNVDFLEGVEPLYTNLPGSLSVMLLRLLDEGGAAQQPHPLRLALARHALKNIISDTGLDKPGTDRMTWLGRFTEGMLPTWNETGPAGLLETLVTQALLAKDKTQQQRLITFLNNTAVVNDVALLNGVLESMMKKWGPDKRPEMGQQRVRLAVEITMLDLLVKRAHASPDRAGSGTDGETKVLSKGQSWLQELSMVRDIAPVSAQLRTVLTEWETALLRESAQSLSVDHAPTKARPRL